MEGYPMLRYKTKLDLV